VPPASVEFADTYVSKTPPSAVWVKSPGVVIEIPTDVIDATNDELSTALLDIPAPSKASHSLPLAEMPIGTTTVEPSLSAYSGSAPLRTQLPPDLPSV
jgi:hypothetical protein